VPRSPAQMHLFTAVSLGFVLLVDLLRFWAVGFDKVHDLQWILMILPLAFTLMSLRILWNLYLSVFRGVDLLDPEAEDLQKLQRDAAAAR